MRFLYLLVAALTGPPVRRCQRGLSQSTETAILVGGAALIAVSVVAVVTTYVNAHLPTTP